ncbi:MAG: choice-of-anchor D domain-containing protein [Proteobacteria bacterium]|nr:choice-of-anchor D domain-containing protein [Pseudomonadota bacterium]
MAANCSWSPATGNWATAGNWSCAGVPGAADSATIAASRTVTINSAQSILNLTNGGNVNIDAFLLTLQGGGSTTNTGTINVGAGPIPNNAALNIGSGHNVNNAGGVINVSPDSVVNQFGSISGGTINTTGSGKLASGNSAGSVLSGVTINGTLDVQAIANARNRIANGMVLNGTANVGNGGILSLDSALTSGGNQTLSGNATINLNDSGARLAVDGTGTTTLASTVVVRGQGNIGQAINVSGDNTLVNNGRISADVSGGTLALVPPANGSGSSIVNNGVLDARSGGTLLINTQVNNTAGQINAQNGSQVVLNGITITGGTLGTAGSGVIQSASNASNVLSGVTVAGTLDMTGIANARQRLVNTNTVNGSVNIGNGGILSLDSALSTGNAAALGGTGVINLNDAGARLAIDGTGTSSFAAGMTIRGQGNIGQAINVAGNNVLTNNALISADVAGGTLSISSPGNGGSSMLRGTGTLQVAGGVLQLATSTASEQGRLVMGNSGTTNLAQNLTLSADYTNAQAGSGNAFNRRAGVTGAGQILAGGDAHQVITGANVTNGNTNNATLTIGNVRVGATTFDYQVGNAGTTGPALRGAIQTAVNGGNISDARLSGAGVTASNYNAGGPGGNSGNLGVTFTAASAGALAPLSGQAINLRSNFENIPDQKLNIALAGGAAAFNAAAGAATPAPVVLANQRVGGSGSQVLTVSNTAAAGSFSEDLRASFGSNTGAATNNGGTINALLAGGSNNSAMRVGVDTSTAGARSGSVTLNYQTAGTVNGVSNGLGVATTGSQTINVTGNVYRMAQGDTSPLTVNLGNRHVGDGATQNLSIANLATNDGFSEKLNASFGAASGSATHNGGGVSLLAAGASNTSSMAVGMDTSSAGSKSGTVAINYQSDGNGTSGLAAIGAGGQSINVTGAVYRLAQANTLGAVSFGNVHVGDTVQQALSISNLATNDGFSEKLNASFGSATDARITHNGGSIGQLAAGASNGSSMVVGLNTGAAGTVNGSIAVNFSSDGAGTSGLGVTALPTQNVGVSGVIAAQGNVYRYASASPAAPNPVNFGNVRIGTAVGQALSISNTAINDGFSERLNASVSSNGAPVTASGAFTLLGPQATNNSSLHVGLDTSSAGAKTGSATIALVSDGTGTSGLGQTNLASQTVNVSGNVFRLANPTLDTPSVTIAARVGDAVIANQAVSITNTSPDSYTEGLKVAVTGASGNAQGGGSIANLAAQGNNSTSVKVGLASTATAGASSGQVTLGMTSTGAGTTGAADISIGSAIVNVVGKVYQQAVAAVQSAVNFGIVHVGDVLAGRNVQVQNTAPVAGLNDKLTGTIGGASGLFAASGNLGAGVQAGQTNSSGLNVSLDTSMAGIFSSSATVGLASHNPDMADLALPNAVVLLNGQVNNFANANLNLISGNGNFSRSGQVITLDFGNLALGSSVNAMLRVFNDISGSADLLDGLFAFLDMQDFGYSGFNAFSNLAAGAGQGGLGIGFTASTLGLFGDDILLSSLGHNASGYSGNLGDITLQIRANVVQGGNPVPEPGTLFLLSIALGGLLMGRRRMILH